MYASPHPVPVEIAIIGGSGVYKLECFSNLISYKISTPFGDPSSEISVATLDDRIPCAFLARHGPHHALNPSEVNYRANICALKQMGVKYVVAINAVGSLDADYVPGDLVVCDQIIDKTIGRRSTFFEGGIVAHVDFAHPTSVTLNALVYQALLDTFPEEQPPQHENNNHHHHQYYNEQKKRNFSIHRRGTAVTMEGPQFSTRAESLVNKMVGGHVIGMTTATEAKLAREAEMAYATVAMVTDMDAWSDAPHVDVAQVMNVVRANVAKAQAYPPLLVRRIAEQKWEDAAHTALRYAVMTNAAAVPMDVKKKLAPILAVKYPAYAP